MGPRIFRFCRIVCTFRLKLMEMWMVVAAAGCGLLAKCWNMVNSKSQVSENEFSHINSNSALANDKNGLGKSIRQQEVLQESHFEEKTDMLADDYVGEFGFGRRYVSCKRGSSVFRGRARVLRAAISKPMSSLESCLTSYEFKTSSCISCARQRQSPIAITDCVLPCHNDINSDEPGSIPVTVLSSLRQISQSSTNADTFACYRLVCFGIGIGIISTIMSSKMEMGRLTSLLKQKEELVEDLEEELEMLGSWAVKDVTDEVEKILDKIPAKDIENVTNAEKVLEAELEKLRFNLHSLHHQKTIPRINEIVPGCSADVVCGQLRGDGLVCNVKSEKDINSSIHEEFITENFAIAPRDFERRLHEVIISRLQDRVVELETELEDSQTKLQTIKLVS